MIFGSEEKNGRILGFTRKSSLLKRIRSYNTGRREVEVGTLLLGNDKNSVIADKVLSYF